MLDFPVVLWVKLPIVDKIHPQSYNKFAMGVTSKATGDSKLNDSPVLDRNSQNLNTVGCI